MIYSKVNANYDDFGFDFVAESGLFLKPIWHHKTIDFWYGFALK